MNGTHRTSYVTDEEKRQAIAKMTLKDDTFFCAVCKLFPQTAEYILRLILDKPGLRVISVETQSDERSLIGRSLCLDILVEDENGKLYDIEVQRSDAGAVPERARYHSAVLDSARLKKSQRFTDLPETCVIFITEGDPLGAGEKICHIERVILEKKRLFNDREHIIYLSMKYADDTPLGDMLHDFTCADPGEMRCPELVEKADYLKMTDKGVTEMCEIMENLNKLAAERAAAATKWQMCYENVQRMLKLGFKKEDIIASFGISEKEFEEFATPRAS